MRQTLLPLMAVLAAMLLSCNGRKHDMVRYEYMIDSIRKAEQFKEMQQQAGLNHDPVQVWFDTLRVHSLPIQTAGVDVDRLGGFVVVPQQINEHFGFPVSANLRALALPDSHQHRVILLNEMQDSITPRLYLYTMDARQQPIDILNIYERKAEDRQADSGISYCECFITSRYDVTVMRYFQSQQSVSQPVIEEVRNYDIDQEGHFVEKPVNL